MPKGDFDPEIVQLALFDPDLAPIGIFDEELVDDAQTVEAPGMSAIFRVTRPPWR